MLTPDFLGVEEEALQTVLAARPEVFNHNIETVRRLHARMRGAKASYDGALWLLRRAKEIADYPVLTKSGIIVGLGETNDEVVETHARPAGATASTSSRSASTCSRARSTRTIDRWVHPDEFRWFREQGEALGFGSVFSGPARALELPRRRAEARGGHRPRRRRLLAAVNHRPTLHVALRPLTVSGSSFRAGEHVTVVASVPPRRMLSRRAVASSDGSFVVRFDEVEGTPRGPSVRASGSKSSAAMYAPRPDADLAAHHQLRRAARGRPSSVCLAGSGLATSEPEPRPRPPAPHRWRRRRRRRASRGPGSSPAGSCRSRAAAKPSRRWPRPPRRAVGFRTPLETAGWNGSNNAEPIVSTIPPGTSENAFTVYLNADGLADFCARPISLATAGSSIVEPFIGASAKNASMMSPVEASIVNDPYRPSFDSRQQLAEVEPDDDEVRLAVAVRVDQDVVLVHRLVGGLSVRVDQEHQAAVGVGHPEVGAGLHLDSDVTHVHRRAAVIRVVDAPRVQVGRAGVDAVVRHRQRRGEALAGRAVARRPRRRRAGDHVREAARDDEVRDGERLGRRRRRRSGSRRCRREPC